MQYLKNLASVFLTFNLILSSGLFAQDKISFRGLVKEDGVAVVEQDVFLLISFIDVDDQIVYEEEVNAQTNMLGIVNFAIGSGSITDNSIENSLDQVDWNNYPILISVSFRLNESEEYQLLQSNSLNSTVYAYYTPFAEGENVTTDHLFDIVSEDLPNEDDMLRFSDGSWFYYEGPSNSLLSANSILSDYTDTANYAFALLSDSLFYFRDTLLFSFLIDSVNFSFHSSETVNSESSFYSDTALFASEIESALLLLGNNGQLEVGSIDSYTFNVQTNSQSRLKFLEDGSINVLGSSVDSGFAVMTENGFLIEYLEDSSQAIENSILENSIYWDPRKRSFYIGDANLYQIPDSGNYAFSGGQNNKSNTYSFSWGQDNQATGNNVVVFGNSSSATRQGLNQFASGVAIGYHCYAFRRCVALGHEARCVSSETGGNSNIALGMNIENSGSGSTSIGSNISSEALVGGTAIGSNINLGFYYGSFIYSDSSSNIISNAADYEFLVRASGGTIFYTDTLMTNGVELVSGSGSWSSVSDIERKENLRIENMNNVLALLYNLPIYGWNYLSQSDNIRHIGPLSNDFLNNGLFSMQMLNEYYGLNAVDMDGLILFGIKGASEQIDSMMIELKNDENKKNNEANLEDLESRLEELEKKLYDE